VIIEDAIFGAWKIFTTGLPTVPTSGGGRQCKNNVQGDGSAPSKISHLSIPDPTGCPKLKWIKDTLTAICPIRCWCELDIQYKCILLKLWIFRNNTRPHHNRGVIATCLDCLVSLASVCKLFWAGSVCFDPNFLPETVLRHRNANTMYPANSKFYRSMSRSRLLQCRCRWQPRGTVRPRARLRTLTRARVRFYLYSSD